MSSRCFNKGACRLAVWNVLPRSARSSGAPDCFGELLMRKPLVVAALSLPFLILTSASHAQSPSPSQDRALVVAAQNSGKPTAATEGESEQVARVNAWTVGLVGGLLEGSFLRFAAELGKALDDAENLRSQ